MVGKVRGKPAADDLLWLMADSASSYHYTRCEPAAAAANQRLSLLIERREAFCVHVHHTMPCNTSLALFGSSPFSARRSACSCPLSHWRSNGMFIVIGLLRLLRNTYAYVRTSVCESLKNLSDTKNHELITCH